MLRSLLTRLKEKWLTLNHKKCDKGISASPTKVAAIKQATEVRSVLGLTNYCSRFISNYATLTALSHELTKKYQRFEWTESCKQAFDQIKEAFRRDLYRVYI